MKNITKEQQNNAEKRASAILNSFFFRGRIKRKAFQYYCKICKKILKRRERYVCCNKIDSKSCNYCEINVGNKDVVFCKEHKYH